ncbi:alpha/beta hydrolase [Luminiphilus sp.]|nr:alpha/beta hydrolase [Luminiphilus sp.]|tara:strand:- start:2506 stop:3432 length:927 start_codon:yes stop_codon:yes gene_type:complete
MAKPLMPALDAEQFAVSLDANVTMRGYRGEVSEGTPLVLLHSINAAPSAMEIRPLFEHYRDKRPVMAPDLPGFGLSDRPAVSYSSVQYAQWIAEWLKAFHSPPDVVALSLTGEFVARAILDQGTRIRSLTLISPTGMGTASPPSLPSGSRLDRVLNSPWVGKSLFRALTTKASIRWFLNKAFVGPTPEYLVQYAWETTRQPGAHLVPLKFLTFRLFTEQAMSRLYSRLTLPCLVLYDDDPNIGFERLSELADANDQWTIKRLVPSMGLPHWELPADTIKALDDFWGLSAQDAALSDDVAEQSARRESA